MTTTTSTSETTDDTATGGAHDDPAARIATRFLERLLTTPAGRAHMLNISVAAEEGDETGVFDQLIDTITEPELRRTMTQHRDDEVRHAGLFRACLERNGFAEQLPPADILVVQQVAEHSDGDGSTDRHWDDGDVVSALALLLAIEERGVQQFPRIADAFEPHDPDTADVYRAVARDERRHVRYCHRIGQRYAVDEASWDAAVAAARVIEAQAFLHVGAANLTYCAEQGWVDAADIFDA